MNFSEIKLTHKERRIIKLGQNQYIYPIFNADRLIRLKLVERELEGPPGLRPKTTGRIRTTELGNDYLQHYRISFRERWIPYWITTGISILAIIIALLTLLVQIGLIQLPHP